MAASYEVTITQPAFEDLQALDGSVRARVLKKLEQLRSSPELGEPLGNRYGLDLTGYRKLAAGPNRHLRIIYRATEPAPGSGGAGMVEVVAVGPREDAEAYRTASRRLRAGG